MVVWIKASVGAKVSRFPGLLVNLESAVLAGIRVMDCEFPSLFSVDESKIFRRYPMKCASSLCVRRPSKMRLNHRLQSNKLRMR